MAALIVVDVQNDFVLPTGALSVPDAERDYHPPGHVSFVSSRPVKGTTQSDDDDTDDGSRYIWPDHCVQGTTGADFHPDLKLPEPPTPQQQRDSSSGASGWYELPSECVPSQSCEGESDSERKEPIQRVYVVRKGENKNVDSYSAFLDNDRTSHTALLSLLQVAGITDVYVCGLALDYCVAFTALDAKSFGFDVSVVTDACRPVALASAETAHQRLCDAGVRSVTTKEAAEEVATIAAKPK